jgi:small subunit ribosomal protein S2
VEVAIPANDDSIRAVDLLLNELADAVAIGKTMVSARQETVPQRPKRVRSKRPAMSRAREEKPRTAPAIEQAPATPVAPVPAAPVTPAAPTAPATEATSPESQPEQSPAE